MPWSTWPRIVMTGGRGTRFSDVPEDANDVEQVVLGRALVDHLELDAELEGEHGGHLVVERGVDGGELVHGHQLADQVVGLDADRLGEAADGDRRLDLGVRLSRWGDGDRGGRRVTCWPPERVRRVVLLVGEQGGGGDGRGDAALGGALAPTGAAAGAIGGRAQAARFCPSCLPLPRPSIGGGAAGGGMPGPAAGAAHGAGAERRARPRGGPGRARRRAAVGRRGRPAPAAGPARRWKRVELPGPHQGQHLLPGHRLLGTLRLGRGCGRRGPRRAAGRGGGPVGAATWGRGRLDPPGSLAPRRVAAGLLARPRGGAEVAAGGADAGPTRGVIGADSRRRHVVVPFSGWKPTGRRPGRRPDARSARRADAGPAAGRRRRAACARERAAGRPVPPAGRARRVEPTAGAAAGHRPAIPASATSRARAAAAGAGAGTAAATAGAGRRGRAGLSRRRRAGGPTAAGGAAGRAGIAPGPGRGGRMPAGPAAGAERGARRRTAARWPRAGRPRRLAAAAHRRGRRRRRTGADAAAAAGLGARPARPSRTPGFPPATG